MVVTSVYSGIYCRNATVFVRLAKCEVVRGRDLLRRLAQDELWCFDEKSGGLGAWGEKLDAHVHLTSSFVIRHSSLVRNNNNLQQ
jgi:hypothetical protein